jgi:energy-coupling factor transporter transmembrane protein EcfT
MSESKSSSGVSIGFFGALTIAFIVLKLCNVIDWSWWWVLAPTWIPVVIAIPLIIWIAYYEAKKEVLQEKIEAERKRSGRKGKFMQRLQEAIDANEQNKQRN